MASSAAKETVNSSNHMEQISDNGKMPSKQKITTSRKLEINVGETINPDKINIKYGKLD